MSNVEKAGTASTQKAHEATKAATKAAELDFLAAIGRKGDKASPGSSATRTQAVPGPVPASALTDAQTMSMPAAASGAA